MASYNEKFQELLKENNPIGVAARWYMIFAVVLTMPIFVLLRRNFGERYFSFSTMVFYLIGFWLVSSIMDGVDVGNLVVWWSFTGLLAAMSLYHSFTIWNRNKRGQRWHSRYDGDSLLDILPGSGSLVRMVYEPLFVLAIGIVIMVKLDVYFLGEWFLASVGVMIFLQRLNQSAARDLYLNAVDSQIESAQMGAVLAGEPAKESEGYVVHATSDVAPKKRKQMLNVMKKGFDTKEEAQVSQSSGSPHVVTTPSPVPKPEALN